MTSDVTHCPLWILKNFFLRNIYFQKQLSALSLISSKKQKKGTFGVNRNRNWFSFGFAARGQHHHHLQRQSILISSDPHMPAAAFTLILKTKCRILTGSDNWDTLIYIWLPGVCLCSSSCGEGATCRVPGPDKSKLLARCCWFSVAAGWVAAEGKQTKCHSSTGGWGCLGWMDGFNYSLAGCVCVSPSASMCEKKSGLDLDWI